MVQFHTSLSRDEAIALLNRLAATNEHLAGYELVSFTPPRDSSGAGAEDPVDPDNSGQKTSGDASDGGDADNETSPGTDAGSGSGADAGDQTETASGGTGRASG